MRTLPTPPREPDPDPTQAEGPSARPSGQEAGRAELEREVARLRAERDDLVARERDAQAASQAAQRRLRAIEYVTEAALEHLDEGDLLAEVLRRVRQVLDGDAAAVHLLGAAGTSLVLRSWSGLGVASREDVIVPVGLGVAGRAARERAPVVIADTALDPELSPAFRQAVRSLLAVPLASRERVLGVLQVGWAAARDVSDDDRRLLQALAARTALALDNARLYGEAHYERARWQAMVASLLDPVVVADAEGRPVYMNPAYERLVARQGARPDDEPFFRDDGTPFAIDDLPVQRAARRGEAVRDVETLLRSADGDEIHVVFSASPLRDPRGRVVGAVAVGRDVTAARAAERERERLLDEVQRRAAELEATMGAIAEGLIVNRPDGQILRMNRAAEVTLGLAEEEMAKPYAERIRLYDPRDAQGKPIPPEEFPVARALRGETLRGELVSIRRGGRELWLNMSSAAIRDASGRTLGTVTTLTDVTRQREAAEQREDLLRAVSHDLRTPLTSVLLQAHRLAAHADPDLRRRGEVITSGARRMEALIRDLVESARLETGQIQLELRALDLGHWLAELLARTPALDASRIALAAGPDTSALADPERLERVVVNLVSNALKYSPPGSPVRIEVARAGGAVVTSVADRGDGIPTEELPKIFGRYYRGQRTRNVEGTGLGLYIARLLVEAHRGRISAESTAGEGSTFRFTLPAAPEPPSL